MAIDLDAQGLAIMARKTGDWTRLRGRFEAARNAALARNPRQLPAATGGPTYTLIDGSTVAVAVSTTAPASTTAYPSPGSRVLSDYEAQFAIEGGYRAVQLGANAFAASARTVQGSNWSDPAGKADSVCRYSTETNAPAITFALITAGSGGNKRMRFLVDGQYVDRSGHALASTSGTVQYFTLTFSTAKVRTVTLETQCRFVLQRVLIVQGSSYYALNRPADRKARLLVVADSYGIGPAVNTGLQSSDEVLTMQGDGLYRQAADWLGVEGIVSAIGGTSFTNGGTGQHYGDRWQDVLDIHAQQAIDGLHIHGSVNDVYGTADVPTIQAAATSYLLQAVDAFPNLPITLSGCFQLAGSYVAKAVQVEAAYAAAVASVARQTGSGRVRFLPVQSPAYVPLWPATPPNAMVCYDGVHLQPGAGGGHESCGRRFAADWFRALVTMA